MVEFVLGVLTGLIIGAFLWTYVTLKETERRAKANEARIRARYAHPAGSHWKV